MSLNQYQIINQNDLINVINKYILLSDTLNPIVFIMFSCQSFYNNLFFYSSLYWQWQINSTKMFSNFKMAMLCIVA